MRKKYWLVGILLLLGILLITACSGTAANRAASANGSTTGASSDGAGAESPQTQGTPQAFQLPTEMKLAMGTMLLDGSAYPVDAAQAETLLPLWKAVKVLSESDTAASEEITAVYKQIERMMTVEQMQVINELAQSPQEMTQKLRDLGMIPEMVAGGAGGNITPEMRATAQAMRDSGQFPQGRFQWEGRSGGDGGGFSGGPPAGMFGGVGEGEGFSPETMATARAQFSSGNGAARMRLGNTQTIDAVITYLEGKINNP